jgi:hypothetical protein
VPPDGASPAGVHAPDAAAATDPRHGAPTDDAHLAPAGEGGGADAGDDDVGDEESGPDPLRFHRWMRSSASGTILTGIALGLQHAMEGRREQPAFVMEAPGEPEDPDAPISLRFDPDDPTRTVAVIRAPSPGGPRDGSPPAADDG